MWNLPDPPATTHFADHEHRLLALLLFTLYLVLWPGWSEIVAQAILLGHFVLFFVWQWSRSHHNHPQTQQQTQRWHNVLLLPLVAAMVVFFHSGVIILWKLMLLGILAGRYAPHLRTRLLNVLMLAFLLFDVFGFNLPLLLELTLWSPDILDIARYLMLIAPVVVFLVKPDNSVEPRENMDFFHALSAFLLSLNLLFGVLLLVKLMALSYVQAVSYATGGLLLAVLMLSGLWLNFAAHDNLQQLWSRHLLNLGHHFEQWLASLTQPGTYKTLSPEQFLESGLQQLNSIPWLCGIGWQSPYGHGALGQESKHKAMIAVQSLDVAVYSPTRISRSYYAHVKLLVQLLEHFHQAKRREEAFAQQAHLKAIHETGAKLTHDIKNLLQSLYVITSAIEGAQPQHFGDTQRLLQGQLPHLSQRLKRTLDKLQQPTQSVYTNIPIRTWWDNLQARYRKRSIEFSMSIMWNANIPEDLFDNVVENLLENALNKRKRESELRIRVALETSENQVKLTVCDNGSKVSKDIEKQLLNQPVPSRDGFGIGLYQAAKQTIHTGYRLHISHNQAGQVCFELASV